MPSITLKEIPEDLRAQLKQAADANFRNLSQEALAGLQRSFEIDALLNTKRDQRWIYKALASGPESLLTRAEMEKVRDRVLARRKAA